MTIWVGQDGTLEDDQGDGAVDATQVVQKVVEVPVPVPSAADAGDGTPPDMGDGGGGDQGGGGGGDQGGGGGGDQGGGGDGGGGDGGGDQGGGDQDQQKQQKKKPHHKKQQHKHPHHKGRKHGRGHGRHRPGARRAGHPSTHVHGEFAVAYDAWGMPYWAWSDGYYGDEFFVGADDDDGGGDDDGYGDAGDEGQDEVDVNEQVEQPMVFDETFVEQQFTPSVVVERPRSWFERVVERFRPTQRVETFVRPHGRRVVERFQPQARFGSCPPGHFHDRFGRCVRDARFFERDLYARYAHLPPLERERLIRAERLRAHGHAVHPHAAHAHAAHPRGPMPGPQQPQPNPQQPRPPQPGTPGTPPPHAAHGYFAGWSSYYPFTSSAGTLFEEGAGQYNVFTIEHPWEPPFEGEEAEAYPPFDEEEDERERMLDQAELDTQLAPMMTGYDPFIPIEPSPCAPGMVWDPSRGMCLPMMPPPPPPPISSLHHAGWHGWHPFHHHYAMEPTYETIVYDEDDNCPDGFTMDDYGNCVQAAPFVVEQELLYLYPDILATYPLLREHPERLFEFRPELRARYAGMHSVSELRSRYQSVHHAPPPSRPKSAPPVRGARAAQHAPSAHQAPPGAPPPTGHAMHPAASPMAPPAMHAPPPPAMHAPPHPIAQTAPPSPPPPMPQATPPAGGGAHPGGGHAHAAGWGFDFPFTDSWGNLITAAHPYHDDYPYPPGFGDPVITGWTEPFTDLEGHLLVGPGEYGDFVVSNPHDHRRWSNVDLSRIDPEGTTMYRVGQDWGDALGSIAQGAASAFGGGGGGSGSALGSGDLGASLSSAFGGGGGGSDLGSVFGQIASTAAKAVIPTLAKAGTQALSQALQQKPSAPPPPHAHGMPSAHPATPRGRHPRAPLTPKQIAQQKARAAHAQPHGAPPAGGGATVDQLQQFMSSMTQPQQQPAAPQATAWGWW